MITKKVIVRLDELGTIKQIQEMQTEEELFALSRKLRMYFELGLFKIPVSIRDAMNDTLDRIYRSL
ncbi:hypothetical protein [Chryseobacterium indoltheticum]|uniref:hypothetical protein n=1 Tax=Chryseobacterium indoltheticum TaxID=254 RepID=UPI0028E3542A|nr:hypothetical protein [Chryseobacterium indoltheticum]